MSKLLLDERPLLIMPSLAVKIGLPEAIFLQQLHYWLERSANVKSGHRWVYNSAKEWQTQFPFWSESTIWRLIRKLEKMDLVISDNFNSLAIDKTKWYRINYVKLHEIENESTDLRNRASSSQIDDMDTTKVKDGQSNVTRPLPESTTESTSSFNNNNDNAPAPVVQEIETPFSFYEKNGFGHLMPHIGQKVGAWIDDMNEALVIHAMKLSLENGFAKWSYTESILKDWHHKKLTSVAAVLAAEEQRQQQKKASSGQGRRYGPPPKEEHVPGWFKKDEQNKSRQQPPEEISESFDAVAERAKLLEEMGLSPELNSEKAHADYLKKRAEQLGKDEEDDEGATADVSRK